MMTSFGGRPVVGLIDTGLSSARELDGADLVVRDFGGRGDRLGGALAEHGTFSVSLLVGQGAPVRGLVPGARLHVATVADPAGRIDARAVARALRWLDASGCRIVAIPLGCDDEPPVVAEALAAVIDRGVRVFAAAGDSHPAPILFPARAPGVVAVGAEDAGGRLLAECNRHPRLDLRAPGLARGLVAEGRVAERRGSSIACVLAAGACALAASPKESETCLRAPMES